MVSELILDLTPGPYTITFSTGFTDVEWSGSAQPTPNASGRFVVGMYTHDAGANWTALKLGDNIS
jgi:hypothetical protein